MIEILVALVVFVIGALAIVRIFPPALGVIQNSENRSIATNLSKSTLAAYENDPALIPDAVYDTDTNFNTTGPDIIAFTGSINTNSSLPQDGRPGSSSYGDSALGHFKRIQGEKQRILIDNSTPTATQPYVLTQFPYNWGTNPAPDNSSNDVLIYVEDRVDGVRLYTNTDATKPPVGNGLLDFSNAKLASDGRAFNDVDYTRADGSTRTTVGTDRRAAPNEWKNDQTRFYVSYNWDTGAGTRIQSVVDEPLASNADVVKASAFAAGSRVVNGPISLRVRRRVAVHNPIADPPNETPRADAMRGYLPINLDTTTTSPILDLLRNGRLVYPSVTVTYTVSDWRWLVEDTVLGAGNGTYRNVVVPTRYIDGENLNGSLNTNEAGAGSVFTMVTDTPSGQPPVANFVSAARWNGTNPTTLNGTGLVSEDPSDPDSPLVNAKTGAVHFADDGTAALRARVVYWTTDQWARQLSVAAKSYVPWYSATGNNNREEWREYAWVGPTGSLAQRGILYFRPSEVGKTVVVTFEAWVDTNNDGTGDTFVLKTLPMTIEDDPVAPPGAMSGFGNAQVAQLKLLDPTLSGSNAVYDVRAIRAVRGASVMVRTAWADGGRYQQEVASTYRPLDEN